MNVNELLRKLVMLKEMGYGDSQVIYDYSGETKSVHVEKLIDNGGFYINLSPLEL